MPGIPLLRVLVLVLLSVATGPTAAHAEPRKCAATIVKAGAAFVQARTAILHGCRSAILAGKLAPGTDCDLESKASAALTKARQRLVRTIVKACAGADGSCGTGDDDALAAIGWNVGTCPGYRTAGCTAPIADCGDIPACLECIAGAAVAEATSLFYAPGIADPDAKREKQRRRCALGIGKAARTLAVTRSKTLAKCWGAVTSGKAMGPCPVPGDAATAALERARQTFVTKVAKACAVADPTLAAIGFPAACPAIGPCGATNVTRTDLTTCASCVLGITGDCADRAAVPDFGPLAACAATSLASPTPSATPTPNPTPQPTLNGSLSPLSGSVTLTTGFIPDPYQAGIDDAGGPVSIAHLGCAGFTSSAPTYVVNYSALVTNAFLRFYFIVNGFRDPSMAIRYPGAAGFACFDDSYGTQNPTLEIIGAPSGRYEIWIAAKTANQNLDGTLFVTELTGNHP